MTRASGPGIGVLYGGPGVNLPGATSGPTKGVSPPKGHRKGTRCRFRRIRGETPAGVLTTALYLPAIIPPISWGASKDFTEYTTVGAGEFATPMGGGKLAKKLRTLDSLDTLIIWWDAPWLIERGLNHAHVRNELYRILDSGRPVSMLLTTMMGHGDVLPELQMDVTFRSVSEELRGGEPDARYFNLGIKEHRDLSVQRRGGGSGRKAGVHLPTRQRLRDTDTLNSLAMEFYGAYKYWRLIRDANAITHKFGANSIIAYNTRFVTGQWIKIPAKPHKSGGVTIEGTSSGQGFGSASGQALSSATQDSGGGGV